MKGLRESLGLALIATVVAMAACGGGGGSEKSSDEVVLRTYEVPQGYDADQLGKYLRTSLASGDTQLGTVALSPDGSVAVTAPERLQESIEQLFADLARRGPRPPEPGPEAITLDYWVLLGRPSPEAGGERVQIDSTALERSKTIRPVLDEIASVQGPMQFRLLEQVRLTCLDTNDNCNIRGRYAEIQQVIVPTDSGTPLATIEIRIWGQKGPGQNLRTRVLLEPERSIVLGQVAYNGSLMNLLPESWRRTDDTMLYFVVEPVAVR